MQKFKRAALFTIAIALLAACSPALFACNSSKSVDYSVDNDFEVEIVETEDYIAYKPKGVNCKYGMIFYVGTAIAPSLYEYLAMPLAAQGYLMVFPLADLYMTYMDYKEIEYAFYDFEDTQFFIGGHSQGGGAAVKRIQENPDKALGAILYSPLCYLEDNIHGLNMPTLLLEAAGDHVLTDEMKASALSRLDEDMLERHMITPGAHMSFSTMDADGILGAFKGDGDGLSEEDKQLQRELTVTYTLSFMRAHLPATEEKDIDWLHYL